MFPLLIALIVFAVVGIAASAHLRKLPADSGDLKQGLAHLAGLRWREFARLVMQAMQARGYEVIREQEGPADGLPTDGGDILLRKGSQRTLLSCKYGNASVVGAPPILGLGKSAELRGAHSAIVVTPGRFDDEARRVAATQHVELIDGATLWPEVKPFITLDLDPAPAAAVSTRNAAIAWLGAAAAGAVAWMLAQGLLTSPPEPTPVPAVATQGAAAPVVAKPAAAPAPATPAKADATAIPTDPAALEKRRAETANAISTLAGVDRAFWSTQSTLLVYLASEDADPSAALCPLLERYPELAASRVQLQPPQGSDKSVRFRQCQAY
ncbi:MAG TPA: restriction endonuclease [Thermomonas sp.]|nr:restriction endonuclease [Thermomonas sp.]